MIDTKLGAFMILLVHSLGHLLIALNLGSAPTDSPTTEDEPPPTLSEETDAATLERHYSFEPEDNFYGQPDKWSRRKGPAFPRYVESRIVRDRAVHGEYSLHFRLNGGQATYYSPPVPIDSWHSYLFRGAIRTQGLENSAAILSVSFLNHRRQRVQRFLSRAVSGTHSEWVNVPIGTRDHPLDPESGVHFAVIGCHVIRGPKSDIHGRVWFDDLWLGKLPRLSLLGKFQTRFVETGSPIRVTTQASGLDAKRSHRLDLKLFDSQDGLQNEQTFELAMAKTSDAGPITKSWDAGTHREGIYRLRSTLWRDQAVILEKETTFAVMTRVESTRRGEFGWSIRHGLPAESLDQLGDVVLQSGINWVKYPLWGAVYSENKQLPADISNMFVRLTRYGITPVGLLNDPPTEMRGQFARDWRGFSEIFMMSPSFWGPSLEPVMARFSSTVRHWQLGSEADESFLGMSELPKLLKTVKNELDRIGRDTHIGVHWTWQTPLPETKTPLKAFLSIDSREPQSAGELRGAVELQKSLLPRWVLLKPLARSEHPADQRVADLVQRMVAAKIGGADAIFAHDVFSEQHGLLHKDGSPSLLYLPWRTTALALQGAEFLGSFQLQHGSKNFVFVRDGKATIILWNKVPTTEDVYLGDDPMIRDVWSRSIDVKVDAETTRQSLQVGPIPIIVENASEPIARWRLALNFKNGRLRSEYGAQSELLFGENTFSQGVSGKVTINTPPDWEVEPHTLDLQMGANEKLSIPIEFTLPLDESMGQKDLSIDFEITSDRRYKFRVHRPYAVGFGDVVLRVRDRKLPDGRLEVDQVIENKTEPLEILSFRCSLMVTGQKRQKEFVTKLGAGNDRKLYYVPNADRLRGKEVWLRAEQVDGRRVLNYRWKVGEEW